MIRPRRGVLRQLHEEVSSIDAGHLKAMRLTGRPENGQTLAHDPAMDRLMHELGTLVPEATP